MHLLPTKYEAIVSFRALEAVPSGRGLRWVDHQTTIVADSPTELGNLLALARANTKEMSVNQLVKSSTPSMTECDLIMRLARGAAEH